MSGHGGGHGGGGGGRRKKHEEHEEHVNHERWLVSYADFITVLMALFIVLFAMAQVDQLKWIELKQSLAVGFSPMDRNSVMDGTDGILDATAYLNEPADNATTDAATLTVEAQLADILVDPQYTPQEVTTPLDGQEADPSEATDEALAEALAELANLNAIKSQVAAALSDAGKSNAVTFAITDRGLVIGMAAGSTYFAANSAKPTAAALQVLDTIAPALRPLPNEISVQGNANTIPAGGQYATNWELSADRAVKVLRHLVDHGGIPAARIEATSFGDARPAVDGDSDKAMAANRRVDILVVSTASDAARALLPSLANGG